MGKGKGSGKGKGGCDCDATGSAFKTSAGKSAFNTAIGVIISESIGSIVDCWPGCCMCCLMGGHCGCCCCFALFLSNIVGAIGGCIPCCCQKNACGLTVMGATSLFTFILRGIIFILLSMASAHYHAEMEDYKDCCKNPPYDEEMHHECDKHDQQHFYGTYAYNYTTGEYNWGYTKDLCADDNLTFHSKVATGAVAFWLTFATVIVGIWMIVSLIGCTCGFIGAKAENDAPPDIEAGEARPTGANLGTAIPAQVVIVQGQPTAASEMVPPQRASAVGQKQIL